jgi:LCP family protein required for cell wall assembly
VQRHRFLRWPGASAWWRFTQRCGIALVITTTIAVGAVAAANEGIDHELDKVPRIKLVTAPEPAAGENFLVIGSDSRAFVADPADAASFGDSSSVQGQRSDTLMVVHVEPAAHRTLVVSFPRDLVVDIPGHGQQKINAAYELGGAQLVIDTLKADFDIDIHHYLAVDFKGFESIVDAVGTVNVPFEYATRDQETGLDEAAGCQALNGSQALAYVRSRTIEEYIDGQWQSVDEDAPDLHRIQRQQDFIRRLATVVEDRALADPSAVVDVIDQTIGSLQIDSGSGRAQIDELVSMLRTFQTDDPDALRTVTVPTTVNPADPLSSLALQQPDADAVFQELRTFTTDSTSSSTVAASDIHVEVSDSTAQGRADAVTRALRRQGLDATSRQATPLTTTPAVSTTQIRYTADQASRAQALIAYFPSAEVVQVTSGPALEIVLGADFSSITVPVAQPAATATTTVPTTTTTPTGC